MFDGIRTGLLDSIVSEIEVPYRFSSSNACWSLLIIATGIGFGVWAFAAKMSLALAAAIVLPVLQHSGYQPDGQNTAGALQTLNLLNAILPYALKLLAIVFVARLPDATD